MHDDQDPEISIDQDIPSEPANPSPSVITDPTKDTYEELNRAYEYFNERLFGGDLPNCMITLRARGRVLGYYSRKRFVHPDGRVTAEIALNPEASAYRSITQCLSTLVHEQVHLYQDHLNRASRRGYHDRYFAQLMQGVGLMPSHTGRPGGNMTGQQMDHYIIEGGPFERAAKELVDGGFKAVWFDAIINNVSYGYNPDEPDPADDPPKSGTDATVDTGPEKKRNGHPMTNLAVIEKMRKRKWKEGDKPAILDNLDKIHLKQPIKKDTSKTKFRCMKCGCKAWAKENSFLKCGNCDEKMYSAHQITETPKSNQDAENDSPPLTPLKLDESQLFLLGDRLNQDDDQAASASNDP